jgi:hypothetical protein
LACLISMPEIVVANAATIASATKLAKSPKIKWLRRWLRRLRSSFMDNIPKIGINAAV